MAKYDELSYDEREIKSFLPTGWNLYPGDLGTWDETSREWLIKVHDEVDFEWPVVVTAKEAEAEGRIQALRHALDRTQRERLGWRTRGLGI